MADDDASKLTQSQSEVTVCSESDIVMTESGGNADSNPVKSHAEETADLKKDAAKSNDDSKDAPDDAKDEPAVAETHANSNGDPKDDPEIACKQEQPGAESSTAAAVSTDAASSAEDNRVPMEDDTYGTAEAESARIDDRPKVHADAVRLNELDTTLNVVASRDTAILSALHGPNGFQYLLAGARANAGIKAGKYMFEVAVLEVHVTSTCSPCLRVGFSAAASPLILQPDTDSISFDINGSASNPAAFAVKAAAAAPRLQKDKADDMIVGVLLDMEEGNISVYYNGKIIGPKENIPASLKGKPLYPTFTYRNVTLQVNFGPVSISTDHRMVGDAAEEDINIASSEEDSCEVIFPIGLPGQGVFTWVDEFIRANPTYTELSDRMLLSWLKKSIEKPLWPALSSSVDRPSADMSHTRDFSPAHVRATLWRLAPAAKRNYVIMELLCNLTADGRSQILRQNWLRHKKRAVITLREKVDESALTSTFADLPDVREEDIASACTGFSLPSVGEGFDDVKYEFHSEGVCSDLMGNYVAKLNAIQQLKAASFTYSKELQTLIRSLFEMKKKQGEWKRKEPSTAVPDDLDIEEISNIEDAYKGGPLYANFEFEDWALVQLRYQAHLLLVAIKRDRKDSDSHQIHHSEFASHYSSFFRQIFDPKDFGKEDVVDVFDLIRDTVTVDSATGKLQLQFDDDVDLNRCIRQAYSARSYLVKLYDAGDEDALLKFPRPQVLHEPKTQGKGGPWGNPTSATEQKDGTSIGRPKAAFAAAAPAAARMLSSPQNPTPPAYQQAFNAWQTGRAAMQAAMANWSSGNMPAMTATNMMQAAATASKLMQTPAMASNMMQAAASRASPAPMAASNMMQGAAPMAATNMMQAAAAASKLLSSPIASGTSPAAMPAANMTQAGASVPDHNLYQGKTFIGRVVKVQKAGGFTGYVCCETPPMIYGMKNIVVLHGSTALKDIPEGVRVNFSVEWNKQLGRPFALKVTPVSTHAAGVEAPTSNAASIDAGGAVASSRARGSFNQPRRVPRRRESAQHDPGPPNAGNAAPVGSAPEPNKAPAMRQGYPRLGQSATKLLSKPKAKHSKPSYVQEAETRPRYDAAMEAQQTEWKANLPTPRKINLPDPVAMGTHSLGSQTSASSYSGPPSKRPRPPSQPPPANVARGHPYQQDEPRGKRPRTGATEQGGIFNAFSANKRSKERPAQSGSTRPRPKPSRAPGT